MNSNETVRSLISVIIPVYNHSRALKKSIASLISQAYRPIEVIIVDDGSTDDFSTSIKEVSQSLERAAIPFRALSQDHAGAGAARNNGFANSKGEFVIFWDADTIAEPLMLEKMYSALNMHPEASYAYSQFKFGWKKMKSQKFDANDLRQNNYIDTTSLIRRSALGERPFDESLHRFQDWDLWLNLLKKNHLGVFVPEVLYKKIVGFRNGLSRWLPKAAYRLPWKSKKILNYEISRQIILTKYGLSGRKNLTDNGVDGHFVN